MNEFINLTPHAITIIMPDETQVVIPPSGDTARVETIETVVGHTNGIPVVERTTGSVIGLPEDESQKVIVSAMVLSAVPGRINTYAPDTGTTAVRNDKGHIVGVTRLVKA